MIPAPPFILRPYQATDAAAMSAAVRESAQTIGRWMTWAKSDFSDYDAICWFDVCNQSRLSGRAHEFGIFDLEGLFVGGCGLNEIETGTQRCNLGYWVRESRQRQGAALAAVHALTRLGFERLGLQRIEIVIAEGNAPSLGVAHKAGAHHEGIARNRLKIQGHPHAAHVFSIIPTTP